jgi:protein SCO1
MNFHFALCLLCGVLSACDPAPTTSPFASVDITGADYGHQLTLPDTTGKPRSLAEFKGKVLVVFFGFSHCPDVCPITMAELAQVKKELGPQGERVQGIFITLDPERDNPQALQDYVTGFDASFIALRGTPEQTTAAAKSFKVFFAKVPGKTTDSYTLDHTAGSYVFDTHGRIRLFTRFDTQGNGVGRLKGDIAKLLR